MPGTPENSNRGKKFHPEAEGSKASIFPVNLKIARDVFVRANIGDAVQRYTFMSRVFTDISSESSDVAVQLFDSLAGMQRDIVDEAVFTNSASEYLFGATIGYDILKEQAKARNIRFPSVSKAIIDGFMQDASELITDDDSIDSVLRYRDKLTLDDSGFMTPIREYAPDPEYDSSQFIFLCSAMDMYSWIQRAETSDRMIREIGLGELPPGS